MRRGERCHQCGKPADGEVSSGPPDHTWQWWCRRCLVGHIKAQQCEGQAALFDGP